MDLQAYLPSLKRFAQRLTRNSADADDLVQECVLRALTKLDQFEPGTNFKGWLTTILTHLFIEKVRRESRYRKLAAAYQLKHTRHSLPDQLDRLVILSVDSALDELPDEQRTALTMVALDNTSYAETARSAGVPVGTIRSRVSRARQSLATSIYGSIRAQRSVSTRPNRPL